MLACGTVGGRAYQKAGLDVIELGDEAIVDVAAFSLQGRSMRGVRQAVARMRRHGRWMPTKCPFRFSPGKAKSDTRGRLARTASAGAASGITFAPVFESGRRRTAWRMST